MAKQFNCTKKGLKYVSLNYSRNNSESRLKILINIRLYIKTFQKKELLMQGLILIAVVVVLLF